MALCITLGELIHQLAVKYEDRPAITMAVSGETLSYREFDTLINRIGHGLLNLSEIKSTYVGIMHENDLNYLAMTYALKKINKIEVSINRAFKGHSLSRMINLTECDIMMTYEHCYGWPRANPTISSGFEPHAKYFLLKSSVALFDNYKIFPFFASVGLLVVTYLFTTLITGKRFAGIISLVIMTQSNLFLSFDTSPTYSNFWTLFYVLSLYLAVRLWMVSPAIYLLSIFTKVLTVTFLPMSIFFVLSSDISRKKKAFVVLVSTIIIAGGGMVFATQNLAETEGLGWNSDEFWTGMSSFANQIRHDGLVILFVLPLVFGLFMVSKRSRYANSIMIMIAGMLVMVPLISGLTEITNQPYRFVPLIFFFAIGVGTLLSKR